MDEKPVGWFVENIESVTVVDTSGCHFLGPYWTHPDLWRFATRRLQDPMFEEYHRVLPKHVDPVEHFLFTILCNAHGDGHTISLPLWGFLLQERLVESHSEFVFHNGQ